MANEDGRETRQASKDNDRFEGNQKTPGSLHSKEANTRMNTGPSGAKRGDDDVDLDGYDGRAAGDAVSKEHGVMEVFEPDDDEDDDTARLAGNDVDDIAEQLLELDDEDTARAIARIVVRTGDRVGDIAAAIEDDRARRNPRMETAD